MSKQFAKELKRVMEENKEKIKIIQEIKTERSKKYNDEELFLLWAYYMGKMNITPYLSCFDLIRKEYGYITYKIYGKESFKFFMKDTIDEKEKWDEKTTRRNASDIVMTYRRRGQSFLRDTLKPKKETDFQKKYLMSNCYGFLNKLGMEKINKLINEKIENQVDVSLRNILTYINNNFKSKKEIYDSVFKSLGEFSIRNHEKQNNFFSKIQKKNKEEFINTWNKVLEFIWNNHSHSNCPDSLYHNHLYLLVRTHLMDDYGYFNVVDTNKLFRVNNGTKNK